MLSQYFFTGVSWGSKAPIFYHQFTIGCGLSLVFYTKIWKVGCPFDVSVNRKWAVFW